MLPMTTLIPVLVFVTTVLAVTAIYPQRARTLRTRLAPYGARVAPGRERLLSGSFVARVAPARERLLSGSFVERVLGPAGGRFMRLAALVAPSTIRAKAIDELAQAGDTMTVEQ